MPSPERDVVIKYNPYFDDTFLIKKTQEPIFRANEVEMINLENKIFLVN
jgi:predicted AAA+ superfamily ATPase